MDGVFEFDARLYKIALNKILTKAAIEDMQEHGRLLSIK
jgi:hypothetical protein